MICIPCPSRWWKLLLLSSKCDGILDFGLLVKTRYIASLDITRIRGDFRHKNCFPNRYARLKKPGIFNFLGLVKRGIVGFKLFPISDSLFPTVTKIRRPYIYLGEKLTSQAASRLTTTPPFVINSVVVATSPSIHHRAVFPVD